ncbi:hypothetical protein HY837_03980 [archaeon]|nr:hypothetical protein [archaeon]
MSKKINKKNFLNNKYFKICAAVLGLSCVYEVYNNYKTPVVQQNLQITQITSCPQLNLWDIPKREVDLDVPSLIEVNRDLDKEKIDQVNKWFLTMSPGNYQLRPGEEPEGDVNKSIVEISGHEKISGSKVSLIEQPESLAQYVFDAEQRITEFDEWIENKGIRMPKTKLVIPSSARNISSNKFEKDHLVLYIVNNLSDYETFRVNTVERENSRLVNKTRNLTIAVRGNVYGEITAFIQHDFDGEIVRNFGIRSYIGSLQACNTELDVLESEISEPLHYALTEKECEFGEKYINLAGENSREIYSDEGVNRVFNNIMQAEEGLVHALTLYYLSNIKGVNVQSSIDKYMNKSADDAFKERYRAVIPAFQIITRIGPEQAIQDYLQGPENLYNR